MCIYIPDHASFEIKNEFSLRSEIKVAMGGIGLGLIFVAIINLSSLDLSPCMPPPPFWNGHVIDFALIAGGIALILLSRLIKNKSSQPPQPQVPS